MAIRPLAVCLALVAVAGAVGRAGGSESGAQLVLLQRSAAVRRQAASTAAGAGRWKTGIDARSWASRIHRLAHRMRPRSSSPRATTWPGRSRILLDRGWRYQYEKVVERSCTSREFSVNLQDRRCSGLVHQAQVTNEWDCRATCCNDAECDVFQWCPAENKNCGVPPASCWTGRKTGTCVKGATGMMSHARAKRAMLLQQESLPIGTSTVCEEEFCQASFDDNAWEQVSLPHDFILTGEPSSSGKKIQGYLPAAKAWYRLRFQVPTSAAGASVWLDFDGVQRTSAAYLNGRLLGQHFSGYTPFRYDIADTLNVGGENVLAVLVDASWPDGWWYDGGGIYRHVWLNIASPVHVAPWGVYLPAKLHGPVSEAGDDLVADAKVAARVLVVNDGISSSKVKVVANVHGPDGKLVGKAEASLRLEAGTNATANVDVDLAKAQLWSLDQPRLYTCKTTVWVDGVKVDNVEDTFGIRKMAWDANQGFLLNDRSVKIKGMANHQDFAGVGVAVPDALQAYRVWTHKEMGANAWRTAHNPPTSALLDEADRQGLLVWDENHRNRYTTESLDELRTMLLRDRNHPSVFMWSICNEALCESYDTETARRLRSMMQELDPDGQRPVTAAVNYILDGNDAFTTQLDVLGVNYNIEQYDAYHERHPGQPLIASETSSDTADRGIYATSPGMRLYVGNGGDSLPRWGATAEDAWCSVADRSFIAGAFYWTGFDYRGEPTPNEWPNVLSHFGIMDVAGFPKDKYFYHQSVFFDESRRPVLHLLPHWNWADEHGLECRGFCQLAEGVSSKLVDVWAYTNAKEVELFLNNQSLGRQQATPCRHLSWSVPYAPGELRAVAYGGASGEVVAMASQHSTGHPVSVALETEWPRSGTLFSSSGADAGVALVTVRLLDSDGHWVPTASADLEYKVTGAGRILGLGNGDPINHEPDRALAAGSARRSAWNGLARVLLQAGEVPGEIELTVGGAGLTGATLRLPVVSA